MIHTDEYDKENILNNHFQSQTILDDNNAIHVIPDLPQPPLDSQLSQIILTPQVKSVLQILPLGKASGPNGLSNRILCELVNETSVPYFSFFNQSLQSGIVPASYAPYLKCVTLLTLRTIDLFLSLTQRKIFERLIFKHLFIHLQDNHLLSVLHSRFMYKPVNMLILNNTFCKAIDAGKEVRSVFSGPRMARWSYSQVLQERFLPGLRVISQTDIKGLCSQEQHQTGSIY